MDVNERYWISVYFTITTITTVGYGDISGSNMTERLFCIFLMISGVVAFSYATGMLTQIMANLDSQNAKYKEQILILNKIYNTYEFPLVLYSKVKNSLSAINDRELE